MVSVPDYDREAEHVGFARLRLSLEDIRRGLIRADTVDPRGVIAAQPGRANQGHLRSHVLVQRKVDIGVVACAK
jgi:hypothetical protein